MTSPGPLAPLEALVEEWCGEAAHLRRRGLEREARLVESFATDLETRLRKWATERLTLEQAAAEVGERYGTLQKRVRRGTLPNAGAKGRPRVRRADLLGLDLPTPTLDTGEPDIAAELLRDRR